MNTTNETNKRLERIYAVIERPTPEVDRPKYELSMRNKPQDDALRALLLAIHNDKRIAQRLAKLCKPYLGHCVKLYDPTPSESEGDYLSWGVKGGKVNYWFETDNGAFRSGRFEPYKLDDGRFYAMRTELPDHFPMLTAEGLERCVINSIENETRQAAEDRKTRQ